MNSQQLFHVLFLSELLTFLMRGKVMETVESLTSPALLWHWTKHGPKIKLKTEIERNENSIEFLTLIFLSFSSLARALMVERYVCQLS